MTVKEIYQYLIKSGLTPEGACALMGNFQAESAMRANNAQDGMTRLSDIEYTNAADNGEIDFPYDSVGYGLAQWTYHSRKNELLNYAKSVGKSVGDIVTQLNYCIKELKRDYTSLWKALCSSNDLYELTSRVCKEYERPAINNITDRYTFALEFYTKDYEVNTDNNEIITDKNVISNNVNGSGAYMFSCPQISKGSEGKAVKLLQRLLKGYGYDIGKYGVNKDGVDGDFGNSVYNAVIKFQKANGLEADAIVGAKTWSKLVGV